MKQLFIEVKTAHLMHSSTVKLRISESSWGTNAVRALSSDAGAATPSSVTNPPLRQLLLRPPAPNEPQSFSSSVDLPPPEGPITPRTCPLLTLPETPRNTGRQRPPLLLVLAGKTAAAAGGTTAALLVACIMLCPLVLLPDIGVGESSSPLLLPLLPRSRS
jgi:hypothetical protein